MREAFIQNVVFRDTSRALNHANDMQEKHKKYKI
jgi:hypothetical protein